MARHEEPEVSVLANLGRYSLLALTHLFKLLWHTLDVTLQIAKGNAERRHRFQERVRVEKDIDALYEPKAGVCALPPLTRIVQFQGYEGRAFDFFGSPFG